MRNLGLPLLVVSLALLLGVAAEQQPMGHGQMAAMICKELAEESRQVECIETLTSIFLNYGPMFGSNSGMINGSNTENDNDNDNNNNNNNLFQLNNSSDNDIRYLNVHVNYNLNVNLNCKP